MTGGGAALYTLGILGLILIWKGITGDVMITRMGDDLFPCWMYIIGGLTLLAVPVVFHVVRSEIGRGWLGI